MSIFKSRQEKKILQQMQRDEQLEIFNEQILSAKQKRQEYAKIAAEAELNGDSDSYTVAVNALIEMNEIVSSLVQAKTNFDIINVSNAVADNLSTAMTALDKMSTGSVKMPNIKKIQKAQVKIQKYMRSIKMSQKAMAGALKVSNPANKVRSDEDIAKVKSLIDAERIKISPAANLSSLSKANEELLKEIEKEKNKIK